MLQIGPEKGLHRHTIAKSALFEQFRHFGGTEKTGRSVEAAPLFVPLIEPSQRGLPIDEPHHDIPAGP